jgi:hypothetical protein
MIVVLILGLLVVGGAVWVVVAHRRPPDLPPAIGSRAYAACSIDQSDCERLALAIAAEMGGRSPQGTEAQYMRGLASIRVVPLPRGAWVLASFDIGGSSTWVGTAALERSVFGFSPHWSLVGEFSVRAGDPPADGSGRAWYFPIGSDDAQVTYGLIGFVDPAATLAQTFDGEGDLTDQATPQDGYFAVLMPKPGQIAFHDGSRLWYTQGLTAVHYPPQSANRVKPAEGVVAAGDAIARDFLAGGVDSLPGDTWFGDDAAGRAHALSGVLGRGTWIRSGRPRGRGVEGDPESFGIGYPIRGPGGRGFLALGLQRIDGIWRVANIYYTSRPPHP